MPGYLSMGMQQKCFYLNSGYQDLVEKFEDALQCYHTCHCIKNKVFH